MATIDWEFHKKQYAEVYAPQNVSKAEYARLFNLPANSARRIFSAVKVDKPEPAKATKKKPKADDINAGVRAVVHQKAREVNARNRKKLKEMESDRQTAGDHPEKSDHIAEKQPKKKKVITSKSDHPKKENTDKSIGYDSDIQGVGHASQSDPENDQNSADPRADHGAGHLIGQGDRLARLAFGAAAEFVGLDPEIQQVATLLTSSIGIATLQSGRLLQMTRTQNALIKEINECYAEGKAWKDAFDNDISKERAMSECVFGYSEQITQLETSINRTLLVSRKLEADEREAHPMTKAQRIARTRELMFDRDKHKWPASYLAYRLEAEGLKVPLSIELEMKKEISWMAPPVDTEGGITDEELERQTQAYMEKREHTRTQWLPQRKEEVSAMLAAELSHQQGDLISEGEFTEVDTLPEDEEALEGLEGFMDGDEPVEEVW